MSGLTLGVLSGLLAALMQSLSYLGGRRFLVQCGNVRQLLIASMVICGIAAWTLAFFFLDISKLFTWKMLVLLIMSNGGFVLGQWGFFCAQKHIESSRIASLLGLKVLVVMLLSIIMVRAQFSFWQYTAIVTAALSAMLMNWSKGKLDFNGMGYLFMALIGYAFSDMGIQLIVAYLQCSNPIVGGLSGYVLTYGTMGVGAILLMKPLRVSWKMVAGALPQGVCWTISMWGLYVCFGLIGAAFGNVIQASRGVISLVLGIVLSYFAINGLEQKQSVGVWLRKAVAAILMFGAIVLYALTSKG